MYVLYSARDARQTSDSDEQCQSRTVDRRPYVYQTDCVHNIRTQHMVICQHLNPSRLHGKNFRQPMRDIAFFFDVVGLSWPSYNGWFGVRYFATKQNDLITLMWLVYVDICLALSKLIMRPS